MLNDSDFVDIVTGIVLVTWVLLVVSPVEQTSTYVVLMTAVVTSSSPVGVGAGTMA